MIFLTEGGKEIEFPNELTYTKIEKYSQDVYEQGQVDGVNKCIALFREWQTRLATHVSEFGDILQQLKEHK